MSADVDVLVKRLKAMREHGGQDYAVMDDAAAALTAMSARVAELEREVLSKHKAIVLLDDQRIREQERATNAERKLAEAERDAGRYLAIRDKFEWYHCYITNTMQLKLNADKSLDEHADAALTAAKT